ncbi:DUF262 domain-containing protein [Saccharothrix hoggarensis]|uniref:DUF262 domain-containing protein n=1 Tax=Saccharothrix hoggarensis TaxID=913853 RepID=A0ABW3QLY1_9PSEU
MRVLDLGEFEADFGEEESFPDGQVDEYDLTSSPNDFNITTLVNFIDSGVVKIPGFQRHYVWDIKRASKLIESLIIGIPVPQIFLYEQTKNEFLVVDGQQRLMTIYYFVKGRFPRKDRRARIRRVFNEYGMVPENILQDSEYFDPFILRLPTLKSGGQNKFTGLEYETLEDYRTQFDLRTIRNVIIKQVKPQHDDSSIYEIFHRLNAGGVLLTPQEIRLSLYHSKFYELLFRLNLNDDWRTLIGEPEPDLHMRDVEVLLRGVALWRNQEQYRGSMVRFLNEFSQHAQGFGESELREIEDTVLWFVESSRSIRPEELQTRHSRFGVTLFEALFAAACRTREQGQHVTLDSTLVSSVKEDKRFHDYSQQKTTDTANVIGRIRQVEGIIELRG